MQQIYSAILLANIFGTFACNTLVISVSHTHAYSSMMGHDGVFVRWAIQHARRFVCHYPSSPRKCDSRLCNSKESKFSLFFLFSRQRCRGACEGSLARQQVAVARTTRQWWRYVAGYSNGSPLPPSSYHGMYEALVLLCEK